jgi:hypothetical protein
MVAAGRLKQRLTELALMRCQATQFQSQKNTSDGTSRGNTAPANIRHNAKVWRVFPSFAARPATGAMQLVPAPSSTSRWSSRPF